MTLIQAFIQPMSKEIKETPILKGSDAQRFIKEMEMAKTEKVSPKTVARMNSNYNQLKSIATFSE
jgi:hypothetical protein